MAKPCKHAMPDVPVCGACANTRASREVARLAGLRAYFAARPKQTREERNRVQREWRRRDGNAERLNARRNARRILRGPRKWTLCPKACKNLANGCACSRCVSHRLYKREWARAHYDPVKARARRESRDVATRRMREWRAQNLERARATARLWYVKNHERALEMARDYRERNPDHHVRWMLSHPESYERNRQRMKKNSTPTSRAVRDARRIQREDVSRCGAEWNAIREGIFARGDCYLCGLPTVRGAEDRALWPSVDHIRPLAKGGVTVSDNLALAHNACNVSKGTKDFSAGVPEWFRSLRVERMRLRLESQQEKSPERRCI